MLLERAYLTSLTKQLRKQEIEDLKYTFFENISFPNWGINQIKWNEMKCRNSRHDINTQYNLVEQENVNRNMKGHLLVIPYHGEKGNHIMTVIKKKLRILLTETVKPDAAFKAMNLSCFFKLHIKLKFNINTTLFNT